MASLIFLAWTAFGLFIAIPELLINPDRYVFADKLLDSWAWALLTPLLLLIDRRVSRLPNMVHVVLLFLVLSIPVSLVHTYLAGLFLYPFPEVWWSPIRNRDFAVYFFLGGLGTYGGVVGILQALRFHSRYLTGQLQLERVQRSLLQSHLHALRLHLEPHFLFNALNSISHELATNPRLARNMIGDLGALLRRSLDCKDEAEITLAQELAILDHYVAIQRVRFGDRMEIIIDADPDALCARVPSMLLQPLVENAIRHGIEKRVSNGRIVVTAFKAENQLELHVVDNGVGLPRQWQLGASAGHGLRVTIERLQALYPQCGEDCLTVSRRDAGGTDVVIHIPFQVTGIEQVGTAA
jgi:signal transduction histidine kinase